ncbi:hypothetical protein B9Z55_012310 [Caenorhabditis nigoni]|nr:hypothetical protein B9Z55_012310 [Caenorhabditis nigoni]
MDVFEIILFSLLSKRAKSIAKRICWYILDIHLTSEGDPQIWLKLPTHPGLDFVIDYNKQYESFAYPGFQSSLKGPSAVHYLVLHDNGNCIEDMKQMVEHICEVFRSPISDIRIFDESLIEWIIKFQPTIGHLWIRDGIISSVNTLDRIFKYLKVTEHFGLQSTPIDKQFQIAEPIPARSIFVRNSFWLTLPSILNGTNSHILVYDSKLTSKDINTILKEWQKGSKLRHLEFLEIEFVQDHTSHSELLDGLKWTESDGNDGRPTTVILFSLLSKRTKSFAKLIRWNLLDIHMTSEGDPQIWFKLPNAPGLDWVIDYNKQEEASVYPVFQSSLKGPSAVHYLVLHNNGNCIDDMKKMVEHICEVFRSPISDIREESLIEWIIKFQPIIRRVWICKDVISSVKTLDRMFKSLKVTEVFGLGPILTDEAFQVTEPIPSRCISFWKSYWLTLPSILNGSNSHIFLYDSNLTAKDINTLLMEWQMGAKLQNLEFLKIEYVAR